ncbi:hypothetical protein AAG570_005464 [Ranatra chinensis]|uniref:Uncharacterized protein n=1 Tax=Ranatra chinensis TaxID=642074 RepID=A0ABD0YFW2_9HEMI
MAITYVVCVVGQEWEVVDPYIGYFYLLIAIARNNITHLLQFLVLAAALAVANAGYLGGYAAAPALATTYAAPAIASYAHAAPALTTAYAAPAIAHTAYAAPALAHTAYAAPALAHTAYAAPALAHGYAAPVARAGLLGVAYSAAPAVAHISFDAPTAHYAW